MTDMTTPPSEQAHYTGIKTREAGAFMEELNELRFAKLQRQIGYCLSNSGYYRDKLRAAGVSDARDVVSLQAFRRLPALITKSEHREIQQQSLEREGHPFGTHLCAPLDKVIHVAGTSGTTGDPTFYTFTRKDLDITLKVFAGLVVTLTSLGVGGWFGAVLPLGMTVAITALEVLVAFLQAYVFTVLTCMYLNDAVHPGH